jgi:uncharacterized membrane protein
MCFRDSFSDDMYLDPPREETNAKHQNNGKKKDTVYDKWAKQRQKDMRANSNSLGAINRRVGLSSGLAAGGAGVAGGLGGGGGA